MSIRTVSGQPFSVQMKEIERYISYFKQNNDTEVQGYLTDMLEEVKNRIQTFGLTINDSSHRLERSESLLSQDISQIKNEIGLLEYIQSKALFNHVHNNRNIGINHSELNDSQYFEKKFGSGNRLIGTVSYEIIEPLEHINFTEEQLLETIRKYKSKDIQFQSLIHSEIELNMVPNLNNKDGDLKENIDKNEYNHSNGPKSKNDSKSDLSTYSSKFPSNSDLSEEHPQSVRNKNLIDKSKLSMFTPRSNISLIDQKQEMNSSIRNSISTPVSARSSHFNRLSTPMTQTQSFFSEKNSSSYIFGVAFNQEIKKFNSKISDISWDL